MVPSSDKQTHNIKASFSFSYWRCRKWIMFAKPTCIPHWIQIDFQNWINIEVHIGHWYQRLNPSEVKLITTPYDDSGSCLQRQFKIEASWIYKVESALKLNSILIWKSNSVFGIQREYHLWQLLNPPFIKSWNTKAMLAFHKLKSYIEISPHFRQKLCKHHW